MSRLNVAKFGQTSNGPALVLLHGWGSSSKIWQPCITELSKTVQIFCVDLPGHGENRALVWDESADQAIELLAKAVPEKCFLVGWSLGGLLAQLFVNRYPQRVQSLMLIASTPKFVASKDWPHAMPYKIFANFVKLYDASPQAVLKKFAALQVLHSASSKQITYALQQAAGRGDQQPEKIRWGLTWLQEFDLRDEYSLKHIPIYLLQGENDQVSSMQVAQDTADLCKHVCLSKIANAGHVPFLSHPQQFIELLSTMLADAG